ncbi:hypothetical protein ACFU5Y_36885, partial [Streptomyces gardneri]|uniref:hypothetical protein n=1 Tax=Streptomyces gardneri TaxID=66892 RepID=UPI0036BCF18C
MSPAAQLSASAATTSASTSTAVAEVDVQATTFSKDLQSGHRSGDGDLRIAGEAFGQWFEMSDV